MDDERKDRLEDYFHQKVGVGRWKQLRKIVNLLYTETIKT